MVEEKTCGKGEREVWKGREGGVRGRCGKKRERGEGRCEGEVWREEEKEGGGEV